MDLLIGIIVLAVVTAGACICLIFKYRKRSELPSPLDLPIIGDIDAMKKANPGKYLADFCEREKVGFVGLTLGSVDCVAVCNSRTFEDSCHEAFLGRMENMSVSEQWNGKGIGVLTAQCPEWYNLRAFLVDGIRKFYDSPGLGSIIDSEVELLMAEYFSRKADGLPFHPLDDVRLYVMNVIFRLSLGIRFDEDTDEGNQLRNTFKEFVIEFSKGKASDWLSWLPSNPEKHAHFREEFHDVLKPTFEKHLQAAEDGLEEKGDNCLVDILLRLQRENEAYQSISDEAFFQTAVIDLQTGAVPSLVREIEWLMIFLCNYPIWQDRIYKEVIEICQERRPSCADIDRLPNVVAFVKESLRILPVTILAVPHRAHKEGQIGGFTIKEDMMIMQNLYGVHHNEHDWEDHEIFRPERFLDEQKGDVTFKWVPFSSGPRMCPGRKIAMTLLCVVLSNLVYFFTFPEKMPEVRGEGLPHSAEHNGIVIVKREPV